MLSLFLLVRWGTTRKEAEWRQHRLWLRSPNAPGRDRSPPRCDIRLKSSPPLSVRMSSGCLLPRGISARSFGMPPRAERSESRSSIQRRFGARHFSPDGRQVVTGCDDAKVRLWSIDEGKCNLRWTGEHENSISAVAFSHGGSYIATGSQDHALSVWEVSTGKRVFNVFGNGECPHGLFSSSR